MDFGFADFAQRVGEPHRSLLMEASILFEHNQLCNCVIEGVYDGQSKAVVQAWYLVGLVPHYQEFVRLRVAGGGEHEEARRLGRIARTVQALAGSARFEAVPLDALGGILSAASGGHCPFVAGMITLQSLAHDPTQEFLVLWAEPMISRALVETVLRRVHKQYFD